MYKKILVPFDNSSQALSAAQHAAKLALVSGAKVTLFHVVHIANYPEERNKVRSGVYRETVLDELKIKAQEMLEQIKDNLAGEQIKDNLAGNEVKIDTAVVFGSPAREILKKASIESYDVIIMGSRGLGKIPGILMGSVSNKVCSAADCPVIVIHVARENN